MADPKYSREQLEAARKAIDEQLGTIDDAAPTDTAEDDMSRVHLMSGAQFENWLKRQASK